MPAMTRVVQIEPGPMPTLTPSAPASARARAAASVATFAGHHVDREVALQLAHRFDHVARVPVGRIDHQDVHAGLDQSLGSLVVVHADGRTDRQAPALVEVRARVFGQHLEVLHRDQTLQDAALVHDDQFLDLVPVQERARVLQRSPRRGRHQALGRHDFGHGRGVVGLEATVAAGQNADHAIALLDNRQARDVEARHQLARLSDRRPRQQGDRIQNDPVGRSLDFVDLADLALNGQVAVDHSQPARPRQGHRELPFGHGIHGRGGDRHVEAHPTREARAEVDVARQDVRFLR